MRPLLLVLAFAACATAPPVRTFQNPDRSQITDVIQAQAAAWNRGDLSGYMAGYANTSALVFTSGGRIRTGWQQALDHYQARYGADAASMGKLRFEVLRIDPVGADAAVVLGRWVLEQGAQPGQGVFSLVFARRPEGWRIIHDHTSVTAPS